MNYCKTQSDCKESHGAQSFCVQNSCQCPENFNRENFEGGRICRKYYCKKNADCNQSGKCVECNEKLNGKSCLAEYGSVYANICQCENGFYGPYCLKCNGYVYENNGQKHCLICPESCRDGPCGLIGGQLQCLTSCDEDPKEDCYCQKFTYKTYNYDDQIVCQKGGCDSITGKCNGQGICTEEKYGNCTCKGSNFVQYEQGCKDCYSENQDPQNYCECRQGYRSGVTGEGSCYKAECGNVGDCKKRQVCAFQDYEYKCVNASNINYIALGCGGFSGVVAICILVFVIVRKSNKYERIN